MNGINWTRVCACNRQAARKSGGTSGINKKLNLFVTPKQGGSNKSAWEISERTIINDLIKYEKKI